MKKSWILIIVPILLIIALYSAVVRVGYDIPGLALSVNHGFLMVSGLFGTLISLERTLTLVTKRWLSIPALSAISVVVLLSGASEIAFALQVVAALGLTVLYLKQWLQFKQVFLLGLALSALAWLMSGIVLLLGQGYPGASIWYILFLLFTITSERLELSKFIATPTRAKNVLLLLFVILFAGQALPFHWGSRHLSGVLIASVGLWLVQYDIVKVNLRKSGFFYYVGSTLFGGYLWLMVSGLLMALPLNTFYHYDAVLHSFFIGFAFMMLFAHAPIIFPALFGAIVKPFHKSFYLPVILTHLLLLARLYADYSENFYVRRWLGLSQVVVFLLFFTLFLLTFYHSIKQKKKLARNR